MAIRRRRWMSGVVLASIYVTPTAAAQQVDVGHKTLGTLGLRAGAQRDAGVYAATRIIGYAARQLRDRNGQALPVGLDLDVFGLGVGLAATFEVPRLSTFLGAAIGVSVAHATAETVRPEASIDRAGLGDLFVQPLSAGWRLPHVDIVASYAFYAPTGRFTPGGSGGVGRGQWTHEPALGTTIYLGAEKTWHLSALASLDVNTKKRNIDITRGSTIQIQGGAGLSVLETLEVGIAAFALWQVSDDSGADLPALLRGARDRSYGLGPELDLVIPSIRGRLTARYTHELASESRPQGQLLLFGLTVAVWKPRPPQ